MLCMRLVALSFGRMFCIMRKRMAGVAATVGVSIAVADGMPPRMSGAVLTAGVLFVSPSICMRVASSTI